MTSPDPLGPEWGTGPGGVRTRSAARVLVVDDAGRVLLLDGCDPAAPEERWWFTPGGGLLAGEEPRAGAARELAEETGVVVDPADLVGPVLLREPEFDWLGSRCRQREVFFLLHLRAPVVLDRSGWTALERASLTGFRWWTAQELAGSGVRCYPVALPAVLTGLRDGWDGTLREVD
ncbi:NUDIX hydrolase [Kineococcus glutinatus]|uniref:Nudix hydrolase domain-containing protein n=1 Tax=Kineococcus glutinatus TaxID=1070872 RepID=A0ABP9HSQ8_9ACTN